MFSVVNLVGKIGYLLNFVLGIEIFVVKFNILIDIFVLNLMKL